MAGAVMQNCYLHLSIFSHRTFAQDLCKSCRVPGLRRGVTCKPRSRSLPAPWQLLLAKVVFGIPFSSLSILAICSDCISCTTVPLPTELMEDAAVQAGTFSGKSRSSQTPLPSTPRPTKSSTDGVFDLLRTQSLPTDSQEWLGAVVSSEAPTVDFGHVAAAYALTVSDLQTLLHGTTCFNASLHVILYPENKECSRS